MKNLKTFEIYSQDDYESKVRKEFGEEHGLPVSEENFKKLVEFGKEHGGVIKIAPNQESKDLAIKYGYKIKTEWDKEIEHAVINHEKVDYVYCPSENYEPRLIDIENFGK